MARSALFLLASRLLLAGTPLAGQAEQPERGQVMVVAPAASTQREAQRIIRACRWRETDQIREADFLLVVVRSSQQFPLAPAYDNLRWLLDEARSQPNESGSQYHVYVFLVRRGGSSGFQQTGHRSYDAPEAQVIPDADARERAAANAGWNCGY